MKKILAIVLAAIMAFSLGVIGFAEGAVEAPAFPTQESGKVYFASEKVEVEAGQVYQIPVYIVSDFTNASTGTLVAGFKAAVTGDTAKYVKVLAISASEDLQALTGYELIGADAEQIAFSTTDLTLLKQGKFHVANVVIEVAADYVGTTIADDGTSVPATATLDLENANFAKYLDNANAILAAATDMAIINGINVEAIDVDFVDADIVEYIPLPWNERIRNWFLEQSNIILTFLVAIFDTLSGLLPTL